MIIESDEGSQPFDADMSWQAVYIVETWFQGERLATCEAVARQMFPSFSRNSQEGLLKGQVIVPQGTRLRLKAAVV